MGAEFFISGGKGKNADEAFKNVVDNALWEYGHGGYSGTIAEKDNFVMIEDEIPEGMTPYKYANHLVDDDRICDKWGPAGCIDAGDGNYLFFGWASS